MVPSILISIKKLLGLVDSDDSFDTDVVMHINTAFATLHQLGLGPDEGFMIEDSGATWDSFLDSDPRLNPVKTYVYYKVRLAFDPPGTSFAIQSMEKQIDQLEWRLNVEREGTQWTVPSL